RRPRKQQTMVNRNDIQKLQVINKMEEILSNWFGTELFWTDIHGKIHSRHLDKDYNFKSPFFKVQLKDMKYGYEYLSQDIERVTEEVVEAKEGRVVYDSFFKGVKGVCSKVEIEGEYVGAVFAYPFLPASITAKEEEAIIAQMVECGMTEVDAKSAVAHMKKLSPADIEYLKELVDLCSEEISTYHMEISKREERI